MKKDISETTFQELKNRSFKLVHIVDMLCEVCSKPISTKEKPLKTVQILTEEDYHNIIIRAHAHDRAEVNFDEGKIVFFDHDFPGDVHGFCIDKL